MICTKKGTMMKRSAFTMIELTLAIVVMGILAALALPRIERDLKQEAADSILSNIRYTQQLAEMDNKQLFNKKKWEQRYWKIMFGTCSGGEKFYMVGSDNDMNGGGFFEQDEAAIDPASGKPLFWVNATDCSSGGDGTVSQQIFITKKFGIDTINFSGGCSAVQHIGFDHLGRPHVGFGSSSRPNQESYMFKDCTITFGFVDSSISDFSIRIAKETGYAYIVGQEDS